jgi:hypothetical protein
MTIWNNSNWLSRVVCAGRPCRAWSLLALALLVGSLSPSNAGEADSKTSNAAGIRSQDQVWLVSTRHIGCATGGGTPAVWQLRDGQWAGSSEEEFHKTADPALTTVIYIHGNRIDNQEGSSGGLAVYQQIVASHADEKGVRYVIWSWPSTKIRGLIKDVRSKAWRSDDESVLLARFLAGIHQPEVAEGSPAPASQPHRVGIVAFSYGARIAGGALHLLNGGELLGQTVPAGERPQFHVAFWAAGEHNNWLLPGCRHGQALPLGEKWLNLVNGCDESLTHYEMLERGHNPPALGYTGLAGRNLLPAELSERWEEWEVSHLVSRTHNYHPYVYSPWVAERTAQVVLWQE